MKQTVDFTLFGTTVFVMLWLDVSELAEGVIRQLDSDCTGTDLKRVENTLCPERGAVERQPQHYLLIGLLHITFRIFCPF